MSRLHDRALAMWVTVSLLALVTPASSQEIEGVWDVRWAQAVRVNADGSVEIQRWGDATLVLTREGDEVRGTWTTDVVERVEWRLAGTMDGATLTLTATENDSSNPDLAIVERLDWSASVHGDDIEGEVSMIIRGRSRPPARRPFTAQRREGGQAARPH